MSYLFGANFIKVTRKATVQVTVESVWDDGTKLDLTDAAVLLVVKAYPEDTVPIFSRKGSHGDGFTIDSPKSGKIVFTLSAAETARLPVGVHYYDLWVDIPYVGNFQIVENDQFEVVQGNR